MGMRRVVCTFDELHDLGEAISKQGAALGATMYEYRVTFIWRKSSYVQLLLKSTHIQRYGTYTSSTIMLWQTRELPRFRQLTVVLELPPWIVNRRHTTCD